jgi:predicted aminopeptidase
MFRELLAQHNGHFAAFYAAVRELAAQRRRIAAAG